MSCGMGRRCSLDLVLPWLWCRLVAAAPIQPLGWELPYAVSTVLKRQKEKKTTPGNPLLTLKGGSLVSDHCLLYENSMWEISSMEYLGTQKSSTPPKK